MQKILPHRCDVLPHRCKTLHQRCEKDAEAKTQSTAQNK
jgi:hypothetical protein